MKNRIENSQFSYPIDVAINPKNGRIIVCEYSNRIQVFDENGKFLMKFGSQGVNNGEFSEPRSVAIDQRRGRIIVVDTGNYRIQMFDENTGDFVSKFGSKGSDDGQLTTPMGVQIDPTNGLTFENQIPMNHSLIY